MGKIILDQYLIDRGLTQNIFCDAYKFSLDELESMTLEFRVIKEDKKKGIFWKMQLFVDGNSPGIDFCLCGYSESIIQQTISEIKYDPSAPLSKQKIKGLGPKNKPFLQWLNEKLNAINSIYQQQENKKIIRAQKAEKKKKNRLQKAEEREKNLLSISLQAIKSFQKILLGGNLLSDNYTFLLNYRELLTEHNFEKFTEFKNKIDAMTHFAGIEFTDIACSALEKGTVTSIFDSQNKLILTIKLKQKQKQKRKQDLIEQVENYHGVNLDGKFIPNFKKQILTLVKKINKSIVQKKFGQLLSEIPEELDSAAKNIQKQFEKQWDKNVTLLTAGDVTAADFEFLEQYGKKNYYFHNLINEIQTGKELEKWIHLWIERLNKYLSEPSLLTIPYITILQIVESSPKYGVRTYAMWLGNSKAKILRSKNLDITFQHKLKHYTIDQIARQIENVINYGWLRINRIGRHELPVLGLTETGKKILIVIKENILPEKIEIVSGKTEIVSGKTETVPWKTEIVLEKTEHVPVQHSPATNPVFQQFAGLEPVCQEAVVIDQYPCLLEKIKNKDRTAWVDFLSSSQNVAQIVDWNQGQIEEICQALNNIMEGWKPLAKWKLIKHPIKYKILARLL